MPTIAEVIMKDLGVDFGDEFIINTNTYYRFMKKRGAIQLEIYLNSTKSWERSSYGLNNFFLIKKDKIKINPR